MTLAIVTDLVGSANPQAVQLTITGATDGASYTVQGVVGDTTWVVRGGNPAVADGTQIVLVDVTSPVNVPVTYSVTDGTTTAQATPVTVPFDGRSLLSSVDGRQNVGFLRLRNNGAPRSLVMRQKFYSIRGRLLPVVRYDVPGGETGQIIVDTIDDQTEALFDLLRLGGLAILRTDGDVRDLPAVQFVLITGADSQLDLAGTDNARTWTLDYQVVGDPEPDAVVAAVTWDDFDAAYAALTWADFDTEWSTATWDDFDRVDWTNH